MWDLSSPSRDRTHAPPALEAQSLNHWTAREVPTTTQVLAQDHPLCLGESAGAQGGKDPFLGIFLFHAKARKTTGQLREQKPQ